MRFENYASQSNGLLFFFFFNQNTVSRCIRHILRVYGTQRHQVVSKLLIAHILNIRQNSEWKKFERIGSSNIIYAPKSCKINTREWKSARSDRRFRLRIQQSTSASEKSTEIQFPSTAQFKRRINTQTTQQYAQLNARPRRPVARPNLRVGRTNLLVGGYQKK